MTKKTSVLEPGEPSTYAHSKGALPNYTYNQALDLKVVTKSGAIRTVRSCTSDEMRGLVDACALTATKKGCASAIAGLDYTQSLDRWFAVLELDIHGCSLPLARADV